ncbi:hypothetical protein [Kangiella sediminilitoris]|uniref:hypothetical protein n=1 Tax=Kangiella sediminilitoris TaxID=1144748 RepID=UPI00083CDCFD|nr:hypothetical protein [Kangiella sediminilitoris]
MYGNRFFSVYGDSPTVGWQLCFTGFAPKKIERGLKNLVESPKFKEWPPTAKQFRDLCLQVSDPANRKHSNLYSLNEITDEERNYGLEVLKQLKKRL